jgi:hypothetical protein
VTPEVTFVNLGSPCRALGTDSLVSTGEREEIGKIDGAAVVDIALRPALARSVHVVGEHQKVAEVDFSVTIEIGAKHEETGLVQRDRVITKPEFRSFRWANCG